VVKGGDPTFVLQFVHAGGLTLEERDSQQAAENPFFLGALEL
jgi:hypothetical protein